MELFTQKPVITASLALLGNSYIELMTQARLKHFHTDWLNHTLPKQLTIYTSKIQRVCYVNIYI